jgi:hypothetical protein
MTIFFGLVAALMTIGMSGFGATALLVRHRLTIWENFALAWLFGTAAVSLSLWIGGFFLRGIALQAGVTVVCIMLGLIGFRRWQRSSPVHRIDSTRAETVFIALFVIEFILMFWISFQRTLGWDGLLIWEIKARYAFLNGGVLPVSFFSDVSRSFSHPHYPLLLPLTETWFYLWIGNCDQFWIKLIFPFWLGAAMSILLVAARELSGSRLVGWMIALLFPLIPCVHDRPGGFLVGYADAPLGAIYLAAVFYLLRFIRNRSCDAMALFIALAVTLLWVKVEGVVLWSTISVCGAAAILQKQKGWIVAGLSFLPGLCLIAVWKIFLSGVHVLPPQDFVSPSLQVLLRNIDRTRGILHGLFSQVIGWREWDIFWLLVTMAIISLLVRVRDARAMALAWLLTVPLVCYCIVYFFSTLPDYIWHIETSVRRLLIHLAPTAALLIALALGPSKEMVKIDNVGTRET